MAGPVGPGHLVPALVISPWSTGDWVCSEPFDHSSQPRFPERRFGVRGSPCGRLWPTYRTGSTRRSPPR
ncbi:MAG TPA: alkaline phosphatase family protein [Actinocatenispora sp.]